MAETKAVKVHVADVIRHGSQFVIPDGMDYKDAIDLLNRRMTYENEACVINEKIKTFVWEGALALNKAMAQMFGWATPEVIPGSFFEPDKAPMMVSIEVGFDETVLVPWGEFSLPGINGRVGTGVTMEDDRVVFQVHAKVLRKHESQIRELIALTRKFVKEASIYRGKAFKLRFKNAEGEREPMPMPRFLDLRKVDEKQLVFSDEVMRAIETSVFTPVEKAEACRRYNIPLKRGILLSGPFGTGKTLAAYVTAKKCEREKWTFLYCERADELAEMVKFAHYYQPCVIFCEDIDRVMSGDRDMGMDDILNIVDGIESKSTEIMVILTTNHVEKINQALLRPGRLDAVINVLPPDAVAVEKLIRLYGGTLIPAGQNLKQAAKRLEGKIPAVIRECIERAKLSALKVGDGELTLSGEAILDAAIGMKNQLDLLEPKSKVSLKESVERAVGQTLTAKMDYEALGNNHKAS